MPYITGPRARSLECRTQNECRVNAPYVSGTLASKTSRTTNFTEHEQLLAELSRDIPEVESRGYERKTLEKKTQA